MLKHGCSGEVHTFLVPAILEIEAESQEAADIAVSYINHTLVLRDEAHTDFADLGPVEGTIRIGTREEKR